MRGEVEGLWQVLMFSHCISWWLLCDKYEKALKSFSIAQILWSLSKDVCMLLTNSISHVIAGLCRACSCCRIS